MPESDLAGDKEVAQATKDALDFKDALTRHLGGDRVALWWHDGIDVVPREGCVTFFVEQPFLLERLRSRLSAELTHAAKEVFGPQSVIAFQLRESLSFPSPLAPKRKRKRPSEPRKDAGFKRLPTGSQQLSEPQRTHQQTMSNFLVGPSNQLAAAAAQLAARQPGAASPLYIHGPTGSGKSHLLEAIRFQMRLDQGLRRVVLMTAEEFTNDFMGALHGSGLPGFRRRYRDLDAFAVDDIQFLDGKRATIREFQFTVDSLMRAGKQLIFTADRPPMELEGIDTELAGRLAGGMVCCVSQLESTTRAMLITRLAESMGLQLGAGVAEQASHRLSGDGRMISGFICRLKAASQLVDGELNWDVVLQFAEDLLNTSVQTVGLKEIQKAVCETFNLPSGALQGRGQKQVFSQPRMLAMYLARRYTRAALSEIGEFFGDRSHSTVIAASKRVERWLDNGNTVRRGERSIDLASAVQTIERQLRIG